MIVFIVVLALMILFLKRESNIECNKISVESYNICTNKVNKTYKIVFLSDIHDKMFGDENNDLINKIIELQPDIILIGGDSMNTRKGKISLEVIKKLLDGLKGIAPIYYGNGNNEQRMTWEKEYFQDYLKEFRTILDNANVNYLDNASTIIDGIKISGLNLEQAHYNFFVYKKLTKEYIEEKIRHRDSSKFNILLSHSPMFLNAYAEWGADLVLTGHSHGGIIRFPTDKRKRLGKIDNDRGLISAQLQLFHKYCAGVFWKAKTCMIVGRGIGTHTINVRINNKPQIVVVNLLHNNSVSDNLSI